MTTPLEPIKPIPSTASAQQDVSLRQPGELLAAIPHVLGFHPVDSLVVVGLHGKPTTTLGLVLRVDLPPPTRYQDLAQQLLVPLAEHRTAGVALAVVGAHDYAPDEELPHRRLLAECESVFADAGIPVIHQVWTPDTAGGAQWRCYDEADCAGILPDPGGTAMAAAAAAAGVVTYDRREDIAATLAPDDDEVLACRAALLAKASQEAEPDGGGPTQARKLLDAVESVVDRLADGDPVLADDEVVELAVALSDRHVRDACLDPGDPDRAAAAERLWASLVRGTPAPERAEPACLLAFCAYVRGDGVLAGIALEQAEFADPGHRLTELLRGALWTGLPPDRIRRAGAQAAAQARRVLAGESR
jgi:hypothetical protein